MWIIYRWCGWENEKADDMNGCKRWRILKLYEWNNCFLTNVNYWKKLFQVDKFVEWIDLELKWWKNLNCLKMKDRNEREFLKLTFTPQPAKWNDTLACRRNKEKTLSHAPPPPPKLPKTPAPLPPSCSENPNLAGRKTLKGVTDKMRTLN